MSLPADSAAVAVLVLAWDETTPAVRALVAATEAAAPAVDSIVVLVPAGPATHELTPAEFLPLADSLPAAEIASLATGAAELLPATALPIPAGALQAVGETGPASGAATALPTRARPPAQLPVAAAETAPPALPAPDAEAAASASGRAGLAALTAAALPGAAVRTLRLSEYSLAALAAYSQQTLPAPAWLGTAAAPAAPYLGSLAADATGAPMLLATIILDTASESVLVSAEAAPAASVAPVASPAATGAGYSLVELSAAPAAESDTQPALTSEQPTLTATASSTELREKAADEFDEALPVDVTPVQAGWPAALASLQKLAAVGTTRPADKPTAASQTPGISMQMASPDSAVAAPASVPAALVPATNQFDAPNLNFQVIQYARFAVPLALAVQPYAVIYAPAWPTWLAAQELRQRTGQPLVLHVAALAAGAEPLDLAAGWPAEIQRQALHQADLILTETPALAYRLRRELALPAHRVRSVPAAAAAAIAQALRTVQVR